MAKKSQRHIKNENYKQCLDIYSGILFNNQKFDEGNNEEITYNFECSEFAILREKYNLKKNSR